MTRGVVLVGAGGAVAVRGAEPASEGALAGGAVVFFFFAAEVVRFFFGAAARFFARFLAGRACTGAAAAVAGGASASPADTGSPARPTSVDETRLVAVASAAARSRPSTPAEIQISRSRMTTKRLRRAANCR